MADLSGKCMCGAATWIYSGPVTRNLVCHCDSCQRATSSPFTAFVGIDPKRLTLSGEVNDYQSSPGTYRGFCPVCGTRLYFRSEKWPAEIHMHAATLNDPSAYTPDAQVVLADKAPWLNHLTDVPQFDGFHQSPKARSD